MQRTIRGTLPMSAHHERGIHYVGTWPAESDAIAMTEMLTVIPEGERHRLRTLPSGETTRPRWVLEDTGLLGQHPDVEVIKPGDDLTYDTMAKYQVKEGHTLNPDHIKQTYYDTTAANWETFEELRQTEGHPFLKYQVCTPGTFNAPLFAFVKNDGLNPLPALRNRKPFEISQQRHINRIMRDPRLGGIDNNTGNFALQIEIPGELGAMGKPEEAVQKLFGRFYGNSISRLTARALEGAVKKPLGNFLGAGIARQAATMPEGSDIIIHNCVGDLDHEAFSEVTKAGKRLEALTKGIVSQWPTGRLLAGYHIPVAGGDVQPSLDARNYKHLGKIRQLLPASTRLIVGMVHEDLSEQQQRDVRNMIEDQVGEAVDISYFCGLGRVHKDPSEANKIAKQIARRTVELAMAD